MDANTLLKLIDKLDKEDLGAPLIVGGSLFFAEAILDVIAGVAAGPVAVGGAVVVIGGKFLYDKVYGDKKKLRKAYLKLSPKLSGRAYEDLRTKLDTAYSLFEEGLDPRGELLKEEIEQCIDDYKRRRNSQNVTYP